MADPGSTNKFHNNDQIVTLYEGESLSPEEIAEGLGFSVEAVKGVLLTQSSIYRRRQKNPANYTTAEELEVVTDDEFDLIRKSYVNLAIGSEVDAVKERAGRFLINEKLGRNKGISSIEKGASFNITLINSHIEAAKKLSEKILDIQTVEGESSPHQITDKRVNGEQIKKL